MVSEVIVTQADRDAAVEWCRSQPFPSKQSEADIIERGDYDHHSLVQAFARHRTAALHALAANVSETMVEAGEEVLSERGCNPLSGDATAAFLAMLTAAKETGNG